MKQWEAVYNELADLRVKLAQAVEMNAVLARKLGLMEAERNHARWKAGRRRTKMREMKKQILELEKACIDAMAKEILTVPTLKKVAE